MGEYMKECGITVLSMDKENIKERMRFGNKEFGITEKELNE